MSSEPSRKKIKLENDDPNGLKAWAIRNMANMEQKIQEKKGVYEQAEQNLGEYIQSLEQKYDCFYTSPDEHYSQDEHYCTPEENAEVASV